MKENFENPSSGESRWEKETRSFLDWLKTEKLLSEEDAEKSIEEIVLTPYEEYREEFRARTDTEWPWLRKMIEFADWLESKKLLTEEDRHKRLARVDLDKYRPSYWETFEEERSKDKKE